MVFQRQRLGKGNNVFFSFLNLFLSTHTIQLVAYYRTIIYPTYIDLITLKSDPSFKEQGVNLAIMSFVYNYFIEDIELGKFLIATKMSGVLTMEEICRKQKKIEKQI